MITPGSGGFGAPAKREPAAIGRDLLDGYVGEQAARDGYGIADPAALRAAAAKEDGA
jgi:N-methylhydantoinase B